MTLLIVDTNEQATAPAVVDRLRKHFKTVVTGNLDAGDINVPLEDGRIIAIERKTPDDFLASIGDGRLFEQIENMAEHAKFYCIMITGYLGYDEDDMVVADRRRTAWRGKSVRAALMSAQMSGCPIINTTVVRFPLDVQEFIEAVSKPEVRKGLKHNRIVTFPPVDERVQILTAFPGVGMKRAEALLTFVGTNNEYGTLSQAIEWATIMGLINPESRPDGWGNALVLNFRKHLGLGGDECLKIYKEPIKP